MKRELLIVDDDTIVLMLHKLKVVKTGLHPSPKPFLNGLEALKFINEHNSEEHTFLVLLDINMPVMDGWEFLDSLQKIPLKCTILTVLVTSSVDTTDKIKAKKYKNVLAYIDKPITDEKVKSLLNLPELKSYWSV